jgi:hypothetical protein
MWQKQPMTTEPVRVEFHMDQNPALAGVLRSAVQFQASQAGFGSETCSEIGSASEGVCRETLSRLHDPDGGLDVLLESFPDRIEVSFLHRAQSPPAVGLPTFASPDASSAGAGEISGREMLSRVDRVLYNTENDKVRTTLVKFLKPTD